MGSATSSASSLTPPKVSRTVANRAADQLDDIRGTVANWYKYYDAYDPQFTWWNRDPYKRLDESLTRYARTLPEHASLKAVVMPDEAPAPPCINLPKGLSTEYLLLAVAVQIGLTHTFR